MSKGKYINFVLAAVSGIALASCSPGGAEKPAAPEKTPVAGNAQHSSALDQIVMDAGHAQGLYWKDMQAQTKGMDDKQLQEWGAVGFGKWYEKNIKRSSLVYFDALVDYGKANLDTKSGFEALLMALEVSAGSGIEYTKIQEIHELMYANYLNTPHYAYVLQNINANQSVGHKPPEGGGPDAWAQNWPKRYARTVMLLNRVVENATNPVVKNHAMLALGDYFGRSMNYMDVKDVEGIKKRRARSEALLNQVIANDEKNPIPLLLSRDIEILNRYKQSMSAASASPDDAKRPPRPEQKIPTLGTIASDKLTGFRTLSVGKFVPATIGYDLKGAEQNMDQYKGRVLLVDFWATWCGPCIAKMPHLIELKKEYAGRPFEILGISADDEPSDVTDFLEDMPLPWDMWFSGKNKGVVKQWAVGAFPTVFLVDHKGVIVSKNPSDKQLAAMLPSMIAEAERVAKLK